MKRLMKFIFVLISFGLAAQTNIVDEKGRKQGLWKTVVEGVTTECNYKNDTLDGEWKSFSKGRLAAQAKFSKGILIGDFLKFHPNGVVALKSIFRDGKMVSGELTYDKKGRLLNLKLPIDTRDKLGAITYYNPDGTEKPRIKIIDEFPITRKYFGSSAHKKGKLDLPKSEDRLN
jgi:antitoxin component YwqK of YwqJK toxin-antitoxin module